MANVVEGPTGSLMLGDNPVRPTTVVPDARGILDVDAGVVAVPVSPGDPDPWIGPGGSAVAEALGLDLFWLLERRRATGKAGEIVSMPVFGEGRGASSVDGDVDVTRVLLVGLGDGSPTAYRQAGAALARAVRGVERLATTIPAAAGDEACLRAFVEGVVLATFGLGTYRSEAPDPAKGPLQTLVLAGLNGGNDGGEGSRNDGSGSGDDGDDDGSGSGSDGEGDGGEGSGRDGETQVRKASALALATWFARELVHTPSNVKDPAWLAERAEEVGKAGGMDVHVRDEKKLAAEGFGGLVGVGMGSARPPRLAAIRYEPPGATADTPHVVLVGKGITFDSGGLTLKRQGSMVTMKTDMSGAAVVLGVLSAARELEVPVRVTGLIAAAENMPSSSAQRPSDVITQYDGTTVEVLNTDAEGRLVLADAIAYAVAELEPSAIVDVATLTGAAGVALGRSHAALFATDDALAADLAEAGEVTGERMWRMPLVDDYRVVLESEVADLANIATAKMSGSAITGALFLEHFVGDVPWAHLDIAGTGRSDRNKAELVKGGTAFGVRALLTWLESHGST